MILAVASGKGGTGKTTVAVSMAAALAASQPTTLVDLDVEAPNDHLFFQMDWQGETKAFMPVPQVDESLCTRCAICSDICQFKAIAVLGEAIVTFDPMCHGCGACWTLCPEEAISQGKRELGDVCWGAVTDAPGGLGLLMGRLRVGEAMSPPLMKHVMKRLDAKGPIIIDAPPGTSCPVMTSTGFADAIVLVTEPTPFGLYDLRLAVEAFTPMNKPMGVVVNRSGLGDRRVWDYCQARGLEIMAEIPFDKTIAQGYSQGRRLGDIYPEWNEKLAAIYSRFEELASPSEAA